MKFGLPRTTNAGLIVSAAALLSLLLLYSTHFKLATKLERSSYDSLFDWGQIAPLNLSTSDVVIIYMDEASYHALGQPMNQPWDRSLHAALLDRLTEEGARTVIFDIVFSDPGPDPEADHALEQAIRRNGKVILASDFVRSTTTPGGSISVLEKSLTEPYQPFRDAAAGTGMAQIQPDDDFLARQHYHTDQFDGHSSLVWVAATQTTQGTAISPGDPLRERWIRYYGKPEAVPSISYRNALTGESRPEGSFRDKIVLIGARPMTTSYIERRDELRSPFSGPKDDFVFMPNVEVHATELLNLLRGDWLNRLPPGIEIGLMAALTMVGGLGLVRLRPVHIIVAAAVLAILGAGTAYLGFHFGNTWFNWQAVIIAPIVLTALGAALYRSIEWYVVRRELQMRQREAQLRIAEQAALLDKAHDAIIVHDFDWKITFWNSGAETTYGWSATEVKGRDIRDLLYGQHREKSEPARNELLVNGEWRGELKHANRGGRQLTIESRWSLVRDADNTPKSVLLINTDVTERRELEAQFLRTQRMESIGTLAGGIAHDLNNVLAPITMGIELVRMRVKDPKVEATLERMAGSALRGAGLVKQVLTFARGHEGERMAVQLSHLIHEMKKIVVETFPRNIKIEILEEPELRPVFADATQLHQVLLNLCVNARDAMPDGGAISIQAAHHPVTGSGSSKLGLKPGDYVRLSVTDTGTGIPEEIREKIFEPFFTTKEIGKGTGLGLSTVNTIVRNHEGALEVLSQPGQGTTFNIFVPVAKTGPVERELQTPPEKIRGNGELVMIVDDESAIRELAASTMEGFGYRVVTAANGFEALDRCESLGEPLALLVTDIMMPVMDGTRTIRALREKFSGLPVIAMSGLLESGDVKRHESASGVIVLPKPFEAIKLIQAANRLLHPPEAELKAA